MPRGPEPAAATDADAAAPAGPEAGGAGPVDEMPTMPPPGGPRATLRWATATGSAPGRGAPARQGGQQARAARAARTVARGGAPAPVAAPAPETPGGPARRPGVQAGPPPASGRRRAPQVDPLRRQLQVEVPGEPPTVPAMTAVMPTVAPPPPPQGQALHGQVGQEQTPVGALGPVRRRRRRSFLFGVLAVLVAVCAAVAIAVAGTSGGSAGQQLADMVSRTVKAQALVRQAEAGVCREAAPGVAGRRGAVAALSTARDLDLSVTASLASQRGPAAAGGGLTVVSGELRRLAAASAGASADLAQWASDRQVAGCYSAPGNDVYYQRARAVEQATAPLARDFARRWAQVAVRWHLPTVDASQL